MLVSYLASNEIFTPFLIYLVSRFVVDHRLMTPVHGCVMCVLRVAMSAILMSGIRDPEPQKIASKNDCARKGGVENIQK